LLAAQVSTIRAFQDVPLAHWLSDRAAARWAQVNVGVFGDVAEREAFLVERLRQLRHTAPMTPVFVHDDYWIGNTLRTGDHVVGVVDWGEAGRGSAARDATYCAVDMRLCYGVDVGDRFLAMFREQVDLPDEEVVAWDARAVLMARFYRSWLVGWNGLGVPVTCEAASERRAELLDRVRSRLR
jgi:aminoglycoside phosphotransferase (APT) family kinase protein